MERVRKQVNNLTIKFNKLYNKYQVITPDKRVLEEYEDFDKAIEWAKTIKDFKKPKKEKISNINDIDNLCEQVNKKYGLGRNEIGSIEHYEDMCENSIVQIANEYRGTIQLVYGDNKILTKYLQGILEDRIKLNIRRS